MGIDAQLEDGRGAQIQFCHDSSGSFGQLLRSTDLSASICLRFIDPFGDTVFNRAQCTVLLEELKSLRAAANADARAYIDNVLRFTNSVSRGVHTFVRFVGD